MKEYNVFVETFSVIIKKSTAYLRDYHYKAIVDGEEYRYKVINGQFAGKLKDKAFGRASTEIQYHAKNQGNIVRFVPVGNVKRTKKKKISKNQTSMFEEGHKYE